MNENLHLTQRTLERLADRDLPADEERMAARHVERCEHCAAQLASCEEFFAELAGLGRFAPSQGFSDAVMARVQLIPATAPLMVRARRWLPKTRRGWAFALGLLALPAGAIAGLLAWLLSQPMVTAGSLASWLGLQLEAGARGTATAAAGWFEGRGFAAAAETVYAALAAMPLETLGVLATVLAVAIPLAAWSLVRLARTPMNTLTHAR